MAAGVVPHSQAASKPAPGRAKFLVGGAILLAAVAYLIVTNLVFRQEYFITVNELTDAANASKYVGKNVRMSGVVLGDTIKYDGETLEFVVAHIPDSAAEIEDEGGLAEILHKAAVDSTTSRVTVIVVNQPKPDLLKHEAQAIVTGQLGEDGVFYADELLLKCPTRYEQDVPSQASGG